MESKKCPACGSEMKRNGRTSAGAQRRRCKSCGSSCSHRYDSEAKQLDSFLKWLLSKGLLFTYLDPALTAEGPLPRTNNRIEGGVNSRLRALLRDHREMSGIQ